MTAECRCSLCMRIGQSLYFSPRSQEYVHDTIKGAPFESVVLPRWTAELCDYCYAFVEGPRKKHVLHSIIEYILSGARTGAPIRPQLLRWIGDLDAESPIVLQLVEFRVHQVEPDTRCTRERLLAVRHLDPFFGPPAICMVRWLFEGGSHVFADMELGRSIRRQRSPISLEGVSPCRRCCGPSDMGGYSGALLGMMHNFADIVERPPVAPGLTAFCFQCRAVTAISFEYHTGLRAAFGLPELQLTSGGYYARIAAQMRK